MRNLIVSFFWFTMLFVIAMVRPMKVFVVVLLIGASGCLSDIELEPPKDVDNLLSIQAKLAKGSPHIINAKIGKVFDFGGQSSPIVVRTVTLSNDLGQEVIVPNIDIETYELEIPNDSPDFVIEDFMSFNLEVMTSSGTVYTSTFEQLLPIAPVDQLDFELGSKFVEQQSLVGGIEEVPVVEINVSSPVTVPRSNEVARFRWTFAEVFQLTDIPIDGSDIKTCYVTQELGASVETTLNPATIGLTSLNKYPIFQNNINFNYAEGNYFIALQHSLTPSAFKYFDAVSQIISREASIFNSPAGRIQSNFTNLENPEDEVFGYFYATTIDTARVFISPESLGSPRRFCPVMSERPVACPSEVCCNCLDQESSTLVKPDWWL